jgi:urease accessory protein UreF
LKGREHTLIRLLHLASPTLPVGAYTYSQGLEWAVETGAVTRETEALAWIGDCLEHGLARFEAVYLAHMLRAWGAGDMARLADWITNSSPAARPPSCAPRPCRWAIRWRSCWRTWRNPT